MEDPRGVRLKTLEAPPSTRADQGIWWSGRDLDLRPSGYETIELTLDRRGIKRFWLIYLGKREPDGEFEETTGDGEGAGHASTCHQLQECVSSKRGIANDAPCGEGLR